MSPNPLHSTSSRPLFRVNSPNVHYSESHIESTYVYHNSHVRREANGSLVVTPTERTYHFRTDARVPKVGMMLVGWGGNNGSTLTASILANRRDLQWRTKEGVKKANYFGSVVMASTLKLGVDSSGQDVFIPFHNVLPMVHPNDLVIGGWDINGANLAEAMERACVLDYDLQRQLTEEMKSLVPLPSIYYPDFIASNQSDRADHLIEGTDKQRHLDQIRQDIRHFKEANGLDQVIVLWTANTERFVEILPQVNDSADNILKAVEASHAEISPSNIFAIASILEGCPFINGSPQNTLVPGILDLAEKKSVFIGGDDFKTGQTKFKSAIVDFLVNAGIKPIAITSYNHLGNNDGKNLSAPKQFRSKEITKSSVVDDMVAANHVLYKKNQHPDHVIVIKYVPAVGDSKRALDEYYSEIFMGGKSTIAVYNTCEDSLLASPIILDLVLVTELMTRIQYRTDEMPSYAPFHSVLSILSYMLKAPVVPPNTPIVNALAKQRSAMENIFRACVGLAPQNDMLLEAKAFH